MFRNTQLVLVVLLLASQPLFAQTGEVECMDANSTTLISTSSHVINGMIKSKLSGQREFIEKYLNETVFLSEVYPDTIFETDTKIAIMEYHKFESGIYFIIYQFSKDNPEALEILNDKESKIRDRSLSFKGTGIYLDVSNPRRWTFYFSNCCIIAEDADLMLENLNANFVPVETMLDLPGGPWNKDK